MPTPQTRVVWVREGTGGNGGVVMNDEPVQPVDEIRRAAVKVHKPRCRCYSCQLAKGKAWKHFSTSSDRAAAILEMHAYYNKFPGSRRKPSEQAFEVYNVRERMGGGLILFVRSLNGSMFKNQNETAGTEE